jgi:hypothetical protein
MSAIKTTTYTLNSFDKLKRHCTLSDLQAFVAAIADDCPGADPTQIRLRVVGESIKVEMRVGTEPGDNYW